MDDRDNLVSDGGWDLWELQRDYGRRPVDWRYRRANILAATNKPPRHRCDDDYVRAALHLLQEDEHGLTQSPYAEVEADIRTAWDVFHANALRRWLVEAWLLTGKPLAEVAANTSMSVQSVRWYSNLFFDVADRIDAKGFIATEVIPVTVASGLNPQDVSRVWMYYAYFVGPQALQILVDDLLASKRPDYTYLVDGSKPECDLGEPERCLRLDLQLQFLPTRGRGAARHLFEVSRLILAMDGDVFGSLSQRAFGQDMIKSCVTEALHNALAQVNFQVYGGNGQPHRKLPGDLGIAA